MALARRVTGLMEDGARALHHVLPVEEGPVQLGGVVDEGTPRRRGPGPLVLVPGAAAAIQLVDVVGRVGIGPAQRVATEVTRLLRVVLGRIGEQPQRVEGARQGPVHVTRRLPTEAVVPVSLVEVEVFPELIDVFLLAGAGAIERVATGGVVVRRDAARGGARREGHRARHGQRHQLRKDRLHGGVSLKGGKGIQRAVGVSRGSRVRGLRSSGVSSGWGMRRTSVVSSVMSPWSLGGSAARSVFTRAS